MSPRYPTLYFLDVQNIDLDDLSVLGSEKERFDRYIREEDKRLFLGGRMLIREHISREPLLFKKNGKPYFIGRHFSLSHSYPYVALFVGSDSVGIDLETEERFEKVDLIRFFPKEDLEKLPDPKKLWCLKEAVYKAYGKDQWNPKEPFDDLEDDTVIYRGVKFYYRFPDALPVVMALVQKHPFNTN